MIRTLNIQGFKAFRSASIESAKRLNVIVGENAAGKTSLLEAVFLASGQGTEIAQRLHRWRGLHGIYQGPAQAISPMLWQDLFHNFNDGSTITINYQGTAPHNRKLEIYYEKIGMSLPLEDDAGAQSPSGSHFLDRQIVFQWSQDGNLLEPVKPLFSSDGSIQFGATAAAPYTTSFFASSYDYSSDEAASRFSALRIKKKTPKAIRTLKSLFPLLNGIDLEIRVGRPLLHADLKNLPIRVPLSLVSSGINKLANLLLALESDQGTVMCIDEIENGLHYSIHGKVWKGLLTAAIESNSQLFVSTHSRESLEALVEECGSRLNQIGFYRVYREKGVSLIEENNGEDLASALPLGEVR